MKKFQRKLSIFFITSVPCFVLASVFFLLVKEEVIFFIITCAFSLFLLCVCFWLRQESMMNAQSICDKKTAYQDQESLDGCIEELQERVHRLEEKIAIHASHIKSLNKKLAELENINSTNRDATKAPQTAESGLKAEDFPFTCNIKGIEDKDELTSGDQFSVMRNGRGVMTLKNFCFLWPNAFEIEKKVTPEMHDLWKSYGLEKLFELSSRDMIHSKIIKITPAEIQITGDKNKDIFQGVLLKKGRIELEERLQ